MRDYSKYEKTPVLFSGAEKKFEIIIDGFRYIVKLCIIVCNTKRMLGAATRPCRAVARLRGYTLK